MLLTTGREARSGTFEDYLTRSLSGPEHCPVFKTLLQAKHELHWVKGFETAQRFCVGLNPWLGITFCADGRKRLIEIAVPDGHMLVRQSSNTFNASDVNAEL